MEEKYIPLAIALMIVRNALLKKNVKKSGRNPMFKSPYFELQDFLPIVMPLFLEQGICPQFFIEIDNMGIEYAYLILRKDNEQMTFKCPTATPSGNNPIFQGGQKITYYRRYLYQMALDLCESDEAEQDTNQPKEKVIERATPGDVATIVANNKLISEELKELNARTANDIKALTKETAKNLVELIKERKSGEN